MTHQLSIDGTSFRLDGEPFAYQGVSFFNAIYNPAFNRDSQTRVEWLRKFRGYGINVLRVWCQWDSRHGFADGGPEATLYFPDGRLREQPLRRLKEILIDADCEQVVIQLVLFSHESVPETKLKPEAADAAVAAVTRELMPYRNLFFQVWNEDSDRVLDHLRTIKGIDPKRLVTNSPGFAGNLGDEAQNRALDFLTPHTTRQYPGGRHWEEAPREIAGLLRKYNKPVVDDEPARNGTAATVRFGGPKDATYPMDHILQMLEVWRVGGYTTYHHDMFQTGYGTPPVPASGIPDPQFSPYHRQAFDFIARRPRYAPALLPRAGGQM